MFFKLLAVFTTFAVTCDSSAVKCAKKICTDPIETVCGSDGNLYYNKCDFENNNCGNDVTVVDWPDCKAKCEGHFCTMEYMPKCGADGIIYGNKCGLLWASCGKPQPVMEEPMINCVEKKCPDNCEENDTNCKDEVKKCREPWQPWISNQTE